MFTMSKFIEIEKSEQNRITLYYLIVQINKDSNNIKKLTKYSRL